MKNISIALLIILLFSCGSDSAEKSTRKKKVVKTEESVPELLECEPLNIKKILDDGKTIIVKNTEDKRYEFWDVSSKRITKTASYHSRRMYYSRSGKYSIRRISSRRYILEHKNGDRRLYRETLYVNEQYKPKFLFSLNERYLIITTKVSRSIKQIKVLDIQKNDYVIRKTVKDLKRVFISENSSLVLLRSDKEENKIDIHNLRSRETQTYILASGKIRKAFLGANSILIQIKNQHFNFDLSSGHLNYSKSLGIVVSGDSLSGTVLTVTEGKDVHVLDVDSDEKIFTSDQLISEVLLSSCRLNYQSKKMNCFETKEKKKLKIVSLENYSLTDFCL